MASGGYKKPDYWSRKAFAEGYPARSVYKLAEIDERFGLIRKQSRVLDLGAAPGSWTAFVLRSLDGTGSVTAVDLNPLDDSVKGTNLRFIQGDMYDEAVRAQVRSAAPYDLVLCDAAPPTTGSRVVDTARSEGLAELALYYAQTMLKEGGAFAVKLFQGSGNQAFQRAMREVFASVKGFKPEACRSASFETYLIGTHKKP